MATTGRDLNCRFFPITADSAELLLGGGANSIALLPRGGASSAELSLGGGANSAELSLGGADSAEFSLGGGARGRGTSNLSNTMRSPLELISVTTKSSGLHYAPMHITYIPSAA